MGRMALVALAAVLSVLGGPVLAPVPVVETAAAGVASASAATGEAPPTQAIAPTRAVEPMVGRPFGQGELGTEPAALGDVDLDLAGDQPVVNVVAAGAALLGMAGVRGPPRLTV